MVSEKEQDKHCFHCGLPVPPGLKIEVVIDQQPQPMCCRGCHKPGLNHYVNQCESCDWIIEIGTFQSSVPNLSPNIVL